MVQYKIETEYPLPKLLKLDVFSICLFDKVYVYYHLVIESIELVRSFV